MKKRKKEVRAGELVYAVISTPPMPRDPEHVRAAKSKMSTQARRALNMKAAYRRLEMLLAANFTQRDLHLPLTYRDSDLPYTRAEAVKRVRKFLAQLRKLRRARGLPFKYVYVTEGKHRGHRLHRHLVINATGRDLEDIRALWPYGDQVDIEPIADREYADLARYITKEDAEGTPVGALLWTGSRNLEKPQATITWVDENETLVPPAGCHIYENETKSNEYAGCSYIKYRIVPPRPRKTRPSRARKQALPPLYERDALPTEYRGH